MIRFGMKVGMMALLLAIALAMPASAQNKTGVAAQIDYIGYGYEQSPISFSSSANDTASMMLTIEAIADDADPVFEVNLANDELTFHVYGLVSGSTTVQGTTKTTPYSGGYLEIWQDGAKNANWGVNPPNATSPSTFKDGELFFQGSFRNFTMYMDTAGYGAFEGDLDGQGGTMIDGSCTDCVYTWGGAYTRDVGAEIPTGYDIQIDGVFQIDSSVDNETSSWGSVKALFRN